MPANSVPALKGIKIHFNAGLGENEFYIDISEAIIE